MWLNQKNWKEANPFFLLLLEEKRKGREQFTCILINQPTPVLFLPKKKTQTVRCRRVIIIIITSIILFITSTTEILDWFGLRQLFPFFEKKIVFDRTGPNQDFSAFKKRPNLNTGWMEHQPHYRHFHVSKPNALSAQNPYKVTTLLNL